MDRPYQHPHSHLFTLRIWEEALGNGQIELRGKIQLLSTGAVRYFRSLSSVEPLLTEMLAEIQASPTAAHEP